MKRRPRPLCACGCGHEVRLHIHTWIVGHMPRKVREDAGKKARRSFSMMRRAAKYKAIIDDVLRGRQTLTRADLYEIANRVGRREFTAGWNARGYKAGRNPWPKEREDTAA